MSVPPMSNLLILDFNTSPNTKNGEFILLGSKLCFLDLIFLLLKVNYLSYKVSSAKLNFFTSISF